MPVIFDLLIIALLFVFFLLFLIGRSFQKKAEAASFLIKYAPIDRVGFLT